MPKLKMRTPACQGDLDGLCGIYSIINAIKTLYPKKFGEYDQEYLFEYLTNFAISEQGNLKLISQGLGLRDMQQLLNAAIECLTHDLNLHIQFTRPWQKQSTPLPTDVSLKRLFIEPKTAIIIGLEQPNLHWSVIRGYFDGEFILLDSQGHEDMPARDILFTRKKKAFYDAEYVIITSSIFVLRRA